MKTMQQKNEFLARHLGPREQEIPEMLHAIGVRSMDELMDQTIPEQIRTQTKIQSEPPMTEFEMLNELRGIAGQNVVLKSYLGQGYYRCITPSVIQRNIFENPGWYTQYTPYQPEISQGRLEALLNFQTMVSDLTGMPVANASLLDEGTAAAEAMTMAYGIVNKSSNSSANKFFISTRCFRQTIDVILTRATPHNIEVVVGNPDTVDFDKSFFGALVQYPGEDGAVIDRRNFVKKVHDAGAVAIVATDLMALALLTPPGEFGADIVVGNSQRFGVPLGFGGPHAAFFATKNEYIRTMPGRIIGVSVDAQNNPAYRLALQTREQHIRREKATSNICTAQALLAIMAGMYAVYHGPDGIKSIATRIHRLAKLLDTELIKRGFVQLNEVYFDTLKIEITGTRQAEQILQLAVEAGYNLRFIEDKYIGISLDETTTSEDIEVLVNVFTRVKGAAVHKGSLNAPFGSTAVLFPFPFQRMSAYLRHPVFNSYHSETAMMRYLKSLENKDLSLTSSMIPLGSCTMKLNAATELLPLTWPEFSALHPFVPADQSMGYSKIIQELGDALCKATGFSAASLQPNSGAQGELTGLLVIRAYHQDHGQAQRLVTLIPSSAHGTNPASAVMAGMTVVVVRCDDEGNIDVEDVRNKASQYKDTLASFMVTYPSTHGVFEERIKEICDIVHEYGGLVYMDGANLNAQVGLTSPGEIGADVCHINLHKTFAIPHGGGGPGMGPICVAKNLAPYLPGHSIIKTGGDKAIHAVASAPWGSANILIISYAYIKMLGSKGLKEATMTAILNANYLKTKLEKYFPVLFQGKNGRVGHEFILNMSSFKERSGVDVEDIAKRLMDYGFHAPTISFPVHETMMIEPTESEPKAELDRFLDAMIAIREEIQDIEEGKLDKSDNPLKHAPHTALAVTCEPWSHQYTRAQAAFPVASLKKNTFWPSSGRINNTYGDRNIFCTCPPVEEYK
ncbi:MAG: glycine dehydrogenase (aminomethyl-transferring) [Ignavibacteriae bacterium]|nr:MAG: glycine dehydrogenase (aminomethyl-transferring) [Ignavibacteriota bacterium]